MSVKRLENIKWYVDQEAIEKGEPGIYHSFMASLATAVHYKNGRLDPSWLMGSSAFAFRIFVNEVMCPSAMSMFDFSAILPEAIEQAGYECTYVCRYWNEEGKEEEKRNEAHAAIVEGIDRGIPAIVWDIADAEWGLITGHDPERQFYETLTFNGKPSSLHFEKLGRNGIDILSVAIPGRPSKREREEVIFRSLQAAVAHAEQKEWIDERPKYQNGLAAYDLWALIFDRWAMIVEAGRGDNIGSDITRFAAYYAGHHYSARCYAWNYLNAIAQSDDMLVQASSHYEEVACHLKPVWDCFSERRKPEVEVLRSLAQNIRSARNAENEGIKWIREYLAHSKE
jgi:hypothetical protein